ncbi:hypothetical protein [Thalassospira sp. NFXS8]
MLDLFKLLADDILKLEIIHGVENGGFDAVSIIMRQAHQIADIIV